MNPLRPYQIEASASILREFEDHFSTLCVSATGTGKTTIGVDIIKRMLPRRTIVVAHREELITQMFHRLKEYGIDADIEMADQYASEHFHSRSPVIISSVQTQISGNGRKRMHRFNPHDFGLLLIDECHHSTAKSYRSLIDHYRQNPELKILGLTATPDRADEEALGQIFETVAFDYEILDAIHDGYLVPVEEQMVTIEGLDFSHVRTTAGDLNGADLAAIMEAEKNLQGIASSSIEIIGDGKSLAFTVTVRQAEMLSDIFNRHRPGMSDWICGSTPKDQRAKILKSFKEGRTQIMVNVGIFTEGADIPDVMNIIQGRPTKSRSLFAQICGRGLRTLPGIIDGIDTPEERRAAIALSDKPSALIIDFVGNSGRHKLMTTADILGGKVSEEVLELAVRKAKEIGKRVRMDELIDEEQERMRLEIEERRRREAARKAKLVGKATYKTVKINPFDAFDIRPPVERGWDKGKALSEKQLNLLRKQGIDPSAMSYAEGKAVLNTLFYRWGHKLASLRQIAILKPRGIETSDLSFSEASKKIDEIATKEGWKKRS